MNYLLYGTEELLIKREIEKIIKQNQIEEINQVEYNLEEESLKNIIDDALTISLFGDKKAIIVEHAYIFTSTTPKGSLEQDVTSLLEYFKQSNPGTILIFTVIASKLDERKKITKKIKEIGSVQAFHEASNLHSLVKEMFVPYQIERTEIDLLVERVGSNLYILKEEIEKIKTYKDQDLIITSEDVKNLTYKAIDADIFQLIECIVSKHKKEALAIYHEMLKRNEEPIKIVIMLANQFRLIYQTKKLIEEGYRSYDIADMLSVHPYRVKLAQELGRKYHSNLLLSLLDALADIDYQIKSGKLEKNFALELFILEL